MLQMHRGGFGPLRGSGLLAAGLLAAGLFAVAPGPARAAQVPWPEEPLSYTVVDQDLRELLAEVGTRLGVSVRVSDAVKARVRGRLPAAAPREFLGRLASVYGFEWFYDGGTLWVSAPSESQTLLLPLGPVAFERLSAAMDELDLSDPRWPLRGSGQAGVVVVNGPPRFVAMAERTLAALQQRARPPTPGELPRIFRGQAVSAR